MLELKNISAGYGKRPVLSDVTASFKKGKLTSIVGLNGSGKSTLLKAMIGILPLSAGSISIDGEDIAGMQRNGIAKKAAYLSQGKNTPDMTVGQLVLHGRFPYLSYPRRYKDEDTHVAEEAMRSVGIYDLRDKPLSDLSGGMKQNAYIAMALAQNTDYILLDEPTTYLDIPHQLALMELLRELSGGGKSIITVMHDLPLAFEFSDEIAVIENGSIKIQSDPATISESDVIREVFGIRLTRLSETSKYYYTK